MDIVYLKRGKDRRKPVNNWGGGGGCEKHSVHGVKVFVTLNRNEYRISASSGPAEKVRSLILTLSKRFGLLYRNLW